MQSTTPGDGSIRSGLSSLVRSAEGVYGLILVAGMIVVSRNLTGTSAQALLSVVVTLVVFFAAHVYAATVSWIVPIMALRISFTAVWLWPALSATAFTSSCRVMRCLLCLVGCRILFR